MCSISSIHTESLHSSGNIHWSCFLMVWTRLSAVKTTSWPGLNFSVMAFVMFAAGSVTGSVVSSRKRLLVLNNVSEVLEKYNEKLIWSLTSSGSFANFNSYSLVCADADPSRKNKSVSMSEETGVLVFPKLSAEYLCIILKVCLVFFIQNCSRRLWLKVNSSYSQHVEKLIWLYHERKIQQ